MSLFDFRFDSFPRPLTCWLNKEMEFTVQKMFDLGMCELNFRGILELHSETGRMPVGCIVGCLTRGMY